MTGSEAQAELEAYFSQVKLTHAARWVTTLSETLRAALNVAKERAALSQWFNPGELWNEVTVKPSDPPSLEWLSALRQVCLVDSSDVSRWRLLDDVRREFLTSLGERGELTPTLTQIISDGSGRAPHIVSALLSGQFDIAQTSTSDLLRASDAIDWLNLAGLEGRLPDRNAIAAALELRGRAAELGQLAETVIGREDELKRLTTMARRAWRGQRGSTLPVIKLEGIGGIGKSTMAAHFVSKGLPTDSGSPAVAWIDFDKLRVHADDISSVIAELSRQLAWEIPDRSDALRNVRFALRESKSAGSAPNTYDDFIVQSAIEQLAEALSGHHKAMMDRPTLVVLDTFEQVERVPRQAAKIIDMLVLLKQRAIPRLLVLISGRAVHLEMDAHSPFNCETLPFTGLSKEASRSLLEKKAGLDRRTAARFVNAFGDLIDGDDDHAFRSQIGVPMLLKLVGRLVQDKKIDLDAADLAQIRQAADGELATAYLYDRVLTSVAAPVRDLAHPGLVLTEVSAESLATVVWPVVRPKARPLDPLTAQMLFDKLAQETWLVEPVSGSDPPRVRHRTDLRRSMLTRMLADQREGARERLIRLHVQARNWHRQERAVSLHSAYHNSAMVYHALQLAALDGRRTGVSLGAIRRASKDIFAQAEDFPTAFQPVLRTLLGEAISADQLNWLEPRLRRSLVADMLSDFVGTRDPEVGLTFASSLTPSDRELNPVIARRVVKLFLRGGHWRSGRDLVEPLLFNSDRPAFDFAIAPRLDPLLGASILGYDSVVDDVLAHRRPGKGASANMLQRYELFDTLFAQLRNPSPGRRMELREQLHRLVSTMAIGRMASRDQAFIRIYGTLMREEDPGRRNVAAFNASFKRGAHSLGIAALRELDAKAHARRSMSQWVVACRSAERERAHRGLSSSYLPLITTYDEFHEPLAGAISAGLRNSENAYRLATIAWEMSEAPPHDLRPSTFAETCADPTARRAALQALVAYVDRSEGLSRLLVKLPDDLIRDPDTACVRDVTLQWIRAFGPNYADGG